MVDLRLWDSGGPDDDAGHEDERASEDDLCNRRPETQFEITVTDVADGNEFEPDDKVRKIQRRREVGQKEGKRVKDAADEGGNPDDAAADGGMPAARVLTRVRETFGKCH